MKVIILKNIIPVVYISPSKAASISHTVGFTGWPLMFQSVLKMLTILLGTLAAAFLQEICCWHLLHTNTATADQASWKFSCVSLRLWFTERERKREEVGGEREKERKGKRKRGRGREGKRKRECGGVRKREWKREGEGVKERQRGRERERWRDHDGHSSDNKNVFSCEPALNCNASC